VKVAGRLVKIRPVVDCMLASDIHLEMWSPSRHGAVDIVAMRQVAAARLLHTPTRLIVIEPPPGNFP